MVFTDKVYIPLARRPYRFSLEQIEARSIYTVQIEKLNP